MGFLFSARSDSPDESDLARIHSPPGNMEFLEIWNFLLKTWDLLVVQKTTRY